MVLDLRCVHAAQFRQPDRQTGRTSTDVRQATAALRPHSRAWSTTLRLNCSLQQSR
jgi:hypothetical protein